MGRIAIEAYLEFADLASGPEVEWDFEAADARARATDLAYRLKDDALRRRAASAVLSMVERYASEVSEAASRMARPHCANESSDGLFRSRISGLQRMSGLQRKTRVCDAFA